MSRVLLTSFEPFDGAGTNPSQEVAARACELIEHSTRMITLPVSFARAPRELIAACEAHRPEVLLSVGLASGRRRPSFERLAVNLTDARIPDNDGAQPGAGEVIPGGPIAAWTTLPVKAAYARLQRAGIDSELSMTAGTFVCNAVFYHGLAWAQSAGAKAGFIHVPPASVPSITETSARAVHTLIDAAVAGVRDPGLPVGALE